MVSSSSSSGVDKKTNPGVQPIRLQASEAIQDKNKEELFESYTGMMSHEF